MKDKRITVGLLEILVSKQKLARVSLVRQRRKRLPPIDRRRAVVPNAKPPQER